MSSNILEVFEDLRIGLIDEHEAAEQLFQIHYQQTWEYKIKTWWADLWKSNWRKDLEARVIGQRETHRRWERQFLQRQEAEAKGDYRFDSPMMRYLRVHTPAYRKAQREAKERENE